MVNLPELGHTRSHPTHACMQAKARRTTSDERATAAKDEARATNARRIDEIERGKRTKGLWWFEAWAGPEAGAGLGSGLGSGLGLRVWG